MAGGKAGEVTGLQAGKCMEDEEGAVQDSGVQME